MSEDRCHRYVLGAAERRAVGELLAGCSGEPPSVRPASLLSDLRLLAHELPKGLRQFVNDVRFGDAPGGVSVISGYPIDDDRLGPTPQHWAGRRRACGSGPEDRWLLMLGELVGDCFGWTTQQDGRLVHDVVPIRGHEHEQLGSSSIEPLTWHTEDAFHPHRGDFLGLMCLRNPDAVGTLVACIDDVELSPRTREVLSQARFSIRPDESHLPKNAGGAASGRAAAISQSYAEIEALNRAPPRRPVLTGSACFPEVCIDPYFMDVDGEDQAAAAALREIVSAIDGSLREIVHRPGDVLFLDNQRVVHGRRTFRARYDGRDRWLKRILVTRDLSRSRGKRADSRSPIII